MFICTFFLHLYILKYSFCVEFGFVVNFNEGSDPISVSSLFVDENSGSSYVVGTMVDECMVCKFDSSGEVEWTVKFSQNSDPDDYCYYGIMGDDGNPIILGRNGYYATLVRLQSTDGSILMSKIITPNLSFRCYGLVSNNETGNLVLVCDKSHEVPIYTKTYLFLVSSDDFSILNQKEVGVLGHEEFVLKVMQNGDRFLITSETWIESINDYAFSVSMWSSRNLTQIWAYYFDIVFEINVHKEGISAIITSDGKHVVVSGYQEISDYENCATVFKVKINESMMINGTEIVWVKKFCMTDPTQDHYLYFRTYEMIEIEKSYLIGGYYFLDTVGSGGMVMTISKEDGCIQNVYHESLGIVTSLTHSNQNNLSHPYVLTPKERGFAVFELGKSGKTCDSFDISDYVIEVPPPLTLPSQEYIVTEDFYSDFSIWDFDAIVTDSSGSILESTTEQCELESNDLQCFGWKCFGVWKHDVKNVCGNNITGMVSAECDDWNSCNCLSGYMEDSNDGNLCSIILCQGITYDHPDVCSSRGYCIGADSCECLDGYEGQFCETWSCGYEYFDSLACGGNGKCTAPNQCECDSGYSGDLCESYYLLVLYIVIPACFVVVLFVTAFVICLVLVVICLVVTILLLLGGTCIGASGGIGASVKMGSQILGREPKEKDNNIMFEEDQSSEDVEMMDERIQSSSSTEEEKEEKSSTSDSDDKMKQDINEFSKKPSAPEEEEDSSSSSSTSSSTSDDDIQEPNFLSAVSY